MVRLLAASVVALLTFVVNGADSLATHPTCEAMESYQASYVKNTYNISKHMGFYYELAFRDLYPPPPMCDCQHTQKVWPYRVWCLSNPRPPVPRDVDLNINIVFR